MYTSNLANYQLQRHIWSQRASLLTRRQEDLTRLQNLISLSTPLLRYSSLSIRQLKAISESKTQELLRGNWAGKEGRDALDLFIELVGLQSSTGGLVPLQEVVVKNPPIVRHHFSSPLCSAQFNSSRNNRLRFPLLQHIIHLTLKSFDALSFRPSTHQPLNLPAIPMPKLSSQIIWNMRNECDNHWLTAFPKLKNIKSS